MYVYEEMPYFGKRSGITWRGLEGLADGLMKVVGISGPTPIEGPRSQETAMLPISIAG